MAVDPCSGRAATSDGPLAGAVDGVVEVAGIEPASAGFSAGILRAQSTEGCRGRRCDRRRRRPV